MTRAKSMRRNALLALAGAVLLAACASENATLRTLDAPPHVAIPGSAEGERVTFRHRSGVTHVVDVVNGTSLPPLLLDGTWQIALTGKPVLQVDVGDMTSGPEDLLSCWTGTGTGSHRATTPEGVRCTQSLVLRVAVEHGYARATTIIEAARSGLGDDRNLWGWYCNIAGDAAAIGAVLGGADGRTLIREEESFCDYSVLHGVGAATVLLHPDDPVTAVSIVCAPDPLANLPTIARTSQCWHGAGTGFARITRLDLLEGERLCRQAPEEASRMNCVEGLFSFARTYRLRGDDVRGNWPGVEIDGTTCNALEGSTVLLETCYRSSAQTLIHDTATTLPHSAAARSTAVETMLATCRESAGEHVTECWAGLGTLVASSLHPDLDDSAEVRRWLNVCAGAPTPEAVLRCFERATLGILVNDQLVTGLAVEEIIELVPSELGDGLRGKLVNWSETLGGRSN